MRWEHEGIVFAIETQALGPLCLAFAQADQSGPEVKTKPFSALGTTREEALQLLREQILAQLRESPDTGPGG
jgi:hypothetical protein